MFETFDQEEAAMQDIQSNPRILIVEDDADINRLLYKILKKNDYTPEQAFSGTEARLMLLSSVYDLILLDLMLPGMTGEELLDYIRNDRKLSVPVVILSAKGNLKDRVGLLLDGADDYLTKPFEPEEVLAHICAVLRRCGRARTEPEGTESESAVYTCRNLTVYPEARRVVVKDTEIMLTAHEFDILHLLIRNPDKVYSRETLYEQVWKGGYYGEDNTVNVHVSNIRKKLAKAEPEEEYIQTVWGIGFKMKSDSL